MKGKANGIFPFILGGGEFSHCLRRGQGGARPAPVAQNKCYIACTEGNGSWPVLIFNFTVNCHNIHPLPQTKDKTHCYLEPVLGFAIGLTLS